MNCGAEFIQQFDQKWPDTTQLFKVSGRERLQFGLGQGGKRDAHAAAVVGVHGTQDHVHAHQPADEFDGAVVLDTELFGQFTHGKGLRPAALDSEQSLMLLWRQPLAVGLGFAENDEAPQRMAELGQGGEISRLQFLRFDIGPLDS